MKPLLLLMMLSAFLYADGQPAGVRFIPTPPFFAGKELRANIAIEAALRTNVNSLTLKNEIDDTAMLYDVNIFRNNRKINLGKVNAAGLYHLEIDLTGDSLYENSYDHKYGMYALFVHSFVNDSSNTVEGSKLRSIPFITQGTFTKTLADDIIDSLINRMNTDTLNISLDTLVLKSISKKAFLCDSINHQSRKLAFILNHYRESSYPITYLTVVIDTLNNRDPQGLTKDSLRSIAVTEFKRLILDTLTDAIDKNSLSNSQRYYLQQVLDSLNPKAEIVYSDNFVSSLFYLRKGIEISTSICACKNYFITTKKGVFDQIVFLMQLPLNITSK